MKEDPKELRRCARAADWQQMRMLLRRMPVAQICSGAGKDEGPEEETGNTALHFAVSINHHRGIRKLMRYGTPPWLPNRAGKTPLHLALEGGKLKAARILLERAVAAVAAAPPGKKPPPSPINVPDRQGVTPLLEVVASGRLKFTREVLAMCKELDITINFDQKDSEGNSLLSYAAKWGWFDELGAWLDQLVLPPKILNLQNKQGETVLGHVLHFHASAGDGGVLLPPRRAAELTSKLLGLGALAKVPSFQERVPAINLAAAADDLEVYNLLIAKGADPGKAKDSLGRTPLHYAAAKGATRVGADLLDRGLKAYVLDSQGNTPLHLAAMRGQEKMVNLLLEKADDKNKALLTPNKSGLAAYHLALKAGPGDAAQSNSLALIELLGESFTTPVIGRKKAVVDTPLLLAISGHQDQVVKKMLSLGLSPNEGNARGELPLARVLSAATAVTYDQDSCVFDQLIAAGADMDSAGETAHPLLAICKNALSKFAEKAVGVLTERCGTLDWNKRDDKGYTPLALAAYWDNAWLVRYLIDTVRVDPNDGDQRSKSTEPEVVGTTGSLCCVKPITVAGTIEGQTPLMCAAKGASVAAVQLLLNRGADVRAVDGQGRTALQHAMALDKPASLQVAYALLQMGARPEQGVQVTKADGKTDWQPCRDQVDETWPHRAVRYGCHEFLERWACCGGGLELTATTADDADDMPGAELAVEEKGDFLDTVPRRVAAVVDEEDEELLDEGGEDSEKAAAAEDVEGDVVPILGDAGSQSRSGGSAIGAFRPGSGGGPVAESTEHGGGGAAKSGGGVSSDDDCGPDEDEERELAALIAAGELESHYAGPTPRMLLRWRRRGAQWWDEFWVDGDSLPDVELESDPHWEDKYNVCEEGDEWIDEEDVEDEIWERINAEQRRAAVEARMAAAAAAAAGGGGAAGGNAAAAGAAAATIRSGPGSPATAPASPSLIERMSTGIAHKLFKRRLPNAAVPPLSASAADEGSFASGSPSKWLRRHSASAASASGPAVASSPGPVAEGREGDDEEDDNGEEEPLLGRTASRAKSSSVSRVQSRGPSAVLSIKDNLSKSMRSARGRLTSGVAGARLYANEPYYQPDTLYEGLPRYMDPQRVNTDAQPQAHYTRHVDDLMARVAALQVKPDKPLEGASLRARNIAWYIKSMGPHEFPLKVGKWKSFLRLSKKAVEAARQRRPCKPGQKPKPRKKTAFFGLPDLPSRPELAHTSPLLYAVRLGRAKCVEVLLRYSAASVNTCDAHGLTPIHYALFLLAKDRHNVALQQIVDMLLAAQPLVDSPTLMRFQLLPMLQQQVAELEEQLKAKEKTTRKERRELEQKQAVYGLLKTFYRPSLIPSIMEPLVLTALMGDVARMSVLVHKCGANLNNCWVWLPDIPAYFQGQWEKQLGRCNSRVPPLHVALCSKKFDLVKAVLDLGADPNLCGAEFSGSGNFLRDLKKQAATYQDKAQDGKDIKASGEGANPYIKLWADKKADLGMMLMGIKNFIASIEIPGLSRPHPWLSPLHLSCRFGLPEITFLLINRGAALNGGSASAFAPKSPLEEALSYARANAQAYGTLSERFNYYYILENTCVEETLANQEKVQEAKEWHKALRQQLIEKVKAKAEALANRYNDSLPADQKDKMMKSPIEFLFNASVFMALGTSIAKYDPAHLLNFPMPGMNAAVAAKKSFKMVNDALSMMDPIKAAIKAVALAAKVMIKVLLHMMKRPIAHYDPALYCAHVMLYHRAPLNLGEKQTGILIRDILDNGNGLPGADEKLSYYRWLGIMPAQMNDPVWAQSVMNKVSVLKANVKYGFMNMDIAKNVKDYERSRRKFMEAVESAVFDTGSTALMPQYFQQLLKRGLVGDDNTSASQQDEDEDPALGLDSDELAAALRQLLLNFVTTQAESQDAKVKTYKELKTEEEKLAYKERACFGQEPQPANRDEIAKGLLPQWVYSAPPPQPNEDGAEDNDNRSDGGGWSQAVGEATLVPGGGGAADAEDTADGPKAPANEEEVYLFIINRFQSFDPKTRKPAEFKPPPTGPDIWEQLLSGTAPNYEDVDLDEGMDYEVPDVEVEELAKVRPTIMDVTDADIYSAVVRAFNTRLTQKAAGDSRRLQAESAARAKAAIDGLQDTFMGAAKRKAEAIQKMRQEVTQPRHFDEAPLFVAALENPMWEAAANKLGGTPQAQALMARLRAAQAAGDIPKIADPLQFAKALGASPMEQGKDALLSKMETQLGQPFRASFRAQLSKGLPDLPPAAARPLADSTQQQRGAASVEAGGSSLEEAVEQVALGATAAVGLAGAAAAVGRLEDAETYMSRVEQEIGADGRVMMELLQSWLEGDGVQGIRIPDLQAFAQELAQQSIHEAPGAVLVWMEQKTGVPLPDDLRDRAKQRVEAFTERVKQRYEDDGISAAIGACTAIAGGCAVAIQAGVVDWAQAQVEGRAAAVEDLVNNAEELLDGNFQSLDGLAEQLFMQLPVMKQINEVADTYTPIAKLMMEYSSFLDSVGDAATQVKEQIKAATLGAVSDLQSLGQSLVDIQDQVADAAEAELVEAIYQFMAGLELMLEVDVAALVEALNDARDAFLEILELMGFNLQE
ncbi:hypothetical protein HYH02_004957 [Chlamydomonas schloesseri]|uniref:Poly [ADP-ribose] polymerase n=1 Tax=Chlamydomonas schloesseri TaxID=2026947 RepID=A0A836B8C0_9CHLO|nr:hypothetical protein HYH02_004957 [Chlamydomonas schloesseri]|eukprot:KAG2450455.1 hypothetical protein HYH02_004957 [Chlamydomonas schloesseri]